MSAHPIPGPWIAVDIGVDNWTIRAVAPSGPICVLNAVSSPGVEGANAQLIALAPDMYLALKAIRDSVRTGAPLTDEQIDAFKNADEKLATLEAAWETSS